MNRKFCILKYGLIFFGIGFFIGWHPIFGSIRNYVIIPLSFGGVIEVAEFLRQLLKDWRGGKSERKQKDEKNKLDYSKTLIKKAPSGQN